MKPCLQINWLAVFILAFFPVFSRVTAQLDSVKYLLEYNPADDMFDMKIVVAGGSANTISRRTQTNAQITIVVPTGADIEIHERFMPLRNNQNFTGTEPNQWEKGEVARSPAISPRYDFYAFVPGLSPASQYNTLKTGDTIRLFSLKIRLKAGCFEDIQLFDRTKFPQGSPSGSGDFSQGFTVGGIKQLYRGNLTPYYPDIKQENYAMNAGEDLWLYSSVTGAGSWEKWTDAEGIEVVEISPGVAKVIASENSTGVYTFVCKNDEMTDIVCVTVEQKTASHDNSVLGTFQIFPNPATDIIKFSDGDWTTLSIFDSYGRQVFYSEKASDAIHVSELRPGMYQVVARYGTRQYSKSFLKI